jgi:adenylate kinase
VSLDVVDLGVDRNEDPNEVRTRQKKDDERRSAIKRRATIKKKQNEKS